MLTRDSLVKDRRAPRKTRRAMGAIWCLAVLLVAAILMTTPADSAGVSAGINVAQDEQGQSGQTTGDANQGAAKKAEDEAKRKSEKKSGGDPADADTQQDATKQDAAKQDAAKQDESKKDAAKQDAAKKDESKKDESKKDESKKDESKKDESKKDESPSAPTGPDSSSDAKSKSSGKTSVEAKSATEDLLDGVLTFVTVVGILFLIFVLPFMIGGYLAKRMRMNDYGWKIGTVLASLALASFVLFRAWDFEENRLDLPLGVDLKGGVILVYQLKADEEVAQEDAQSGTRQTRVTGDLIAALQNRINPTGTQEIVVRGYGPDHVEIIIPDVDATEVARIKRSVTESGALEFRIIADRSDHELLFKAAEDQANNVDRRIKTSPAVRIDGERAGFWARMDREADPVNGVKPFKVDLRVLPSGGTAELIRIAEHNTDPNLVGDIIELAPGLQIDELNHLAKILDEQGITAIDVLMYVDDYNVNGGDLGVVSRGVDEVAKPCVDFGMRGDGAVRFGGLTSRYSPDPQTGRDYRLGIVMSDVLKTAPSIRTRITSSGKITGRFTEAEIDFMVGILQSGRLPATLEDEPTSENQIGAMLGEETIRAGTRSIGLSLIAVLIFILIYYRWAGVVACLALLSNLLFILALMVLLKAPLTLPGLAGLVLTVGMSVDANVLIFERIREELSHGAALRMAIRNGFQRATSTIVDANVTTLITAAVLYVIGTDQIRGFAVTLIFGILMSMYTAIFGSRLVFDIAERRGIIKKLTMMRLVGATGFDFIGKRHIAAVVSIILIVIGLVGVVSRTRNRDLLDIDFLGGTSVTVLFNEGVPVDEVRDQLDEQFAKQTKKIQFTVNEVSVKNRDAQTVYRVTSSLEDSTELKNMVVAAFEPGVVATYSITIGDVKAYGAGATQETSQTRPVPLQPTPPQPTPPQPTPSQWVSTGEATYFVSQDENQAGADADAQAKTKQDDADPSAAKQDETKQDEAKQDEAKQDEAKQDEAKQDEAKQDAGADTELQGSPGSEMTSGTTAVIGFKEDFPINAASLVMLIDEAVEKAGMDKILVNLDAKKDDGTFEYTQNTSLSEHSTWKITFPTNESDTQHILEELEMKIEGQPVIPSSTKIGSKVAEDTKSDAILALLGSLIGIIAYIWIRFQRVEFGLAAVVALVHDVLITLGAIAVSYWLASVFGFLMIEEFKISLPVVAAFLTIIGYSLNDTIVVFDRIREVRGKSPELTGEMINTSINQTLGRTLLTSTTTLIVVLILYFLGGQGIHAFAFALVIGVIVGTYSSVFVAAPTLMFLLNAVNKRREAAKVASKTAAM